MITGIDVRISDKAEITRPHLVTIGNHVAIDMGVYISVSATIGDYIHIAPHVCIIGGKTAKLIMEDFTGISAGCTIICCSDDFKKGMIGPTIPVKHRCLINAPVVFKKFSTIGVHSVVFPGVTLAEGSVIGANSLVTKNTKPWGVYFGSPAKLVGWRDKELILKGAKELGDNYE